MRKQEKKFLTLPSALAQTLVVIELNAAGLHLGIGLELGLLFWLLCCHGFLLSHLAQTLVMIQRKASGFHLGIGLELGLLFWFLCCHGSSFLRLAQALVVVEVDAVRDPAGLDVRLDLGLLCWFLCRHDFLLWLPSAGARCG